MHCAVNTILDHYCLARSRGDVGTQLEISRKLVDAVIPELMARLAALEATADRRDLSYEAQEEDTRG